MAGPIFTLSAYDLTWLTHARSAAELAQRIAALAARHGTTVQAVQDAVWSTGVVDGLGASGAAVRATAQASARGAARRIAELGGRAVVRQAGRQVAAQGARTAGATLVGGLGATVGTVLGVTVLIGVLAMGAYAASQAHNTYQQRQHPQESSVDRFRPGVRSTPSGHRVRPSVAESGTQDPGNLYSPQNVIGPHVDGRGREIPGARRKLNHGGHLEFESAGRAGSTGR